LSLHRIRGALFSLLSVGLGISAIRITRDFVENRRRLWGTDRPGVGSRGGPAGFIITSLAVRDERQVEDEEDKKRTSGEED